MGATTLGIPYPDSTDNYRPKEDMQALAEAVDALIDAAQDIPVVRLVQQATQNFADNVTQAVTFGAGSDDIDTNNFHDEVTNNNRITPTVAGIYEVHGVTCFGGRSDYRILDAWIRKNGVTSLAPAGRRNLGAQVSATNQTPESTCLVSMNGTTDYIEMLAVQTNTGVVTVATAVGTQLASVLEMKFVRPL